MTPRQSIDYLPVLTRGKHRSPRQGACFMEFASYLAGERWSDHPRCTHPLLAALARHVNDVLPDDRRQDLLGLVPDVIGLATSDRRADVLIALRAATTALPVVSEERQQVMALAVLTCERQLAELDDRAADAPLSARSTAAFDSTPGAAAWARQHRRDTRLPARVFRRQTAPAIVRCAVPWIRQACVADPSEILVELLAGAIDDCRTCCATRQDTTAPAQTTTRAAYSRS
jgi:hypothetical protein